MAAAEVAFLFSRLIDLAFFKLVDEAIRTAPSDKNQWGEHAAEGLA